MFTNLCVNSGFLRGDNGIYALWDFTQIRMVDSYGRFGTSVGPIFKDRAVAFPETSVRIYLSLLCKIAKECRRQL